MTIKETGAVSAQQLVQKPSAKKVELNPQPPKASADLTPESTKADEGGLSAAKSSSSKIDLEA